MIFLIFLHLYFVEYHGICTLSRKMTSFSESKDIIVL